MYGVYVVYGGGVGIFDIFVFVEQWNRRATLPLTRRRSKFGFYGPRDVFLMRMMQSRNDSVL